MTSSIKTKLVRAHVVLVPAPTESPDAECIVVRDVAKLIVPDSKPNSREDSRENEHSPLMTSYDSLPNNSFIRLSDCSSDESISADIIPREPGDGYMFCSMWQRIPTPDRLRLLNESPPTTSIEEPFRPRGSGEASVLACKPSYRDSGHEDLIERSSTISPQDQLGDKKVRNPPQDDQQEMVSQKNAVPESKSSGMKLLVQAYKDLHQNEPTGQLSACASDDSISADFRRYSAERRNRVKNLRRIPSPEKIHKFNKGNLTPKRTDSYSGYVGGAEIDYTDPRSQNDARRRSRISPEVSQKSRPNSSPLAALVKQPTKMSIHDDTPAYNPSNECYKKPCYLVPLTEESQDELYQLNLPNEDLRHNNQANKSSGIHRQYLMSDKMSPPADNHVSPPPSPNTKKMLDRLLVAVSYMDNESIHHFIKDNDDDGSLDSKKKKKKKEISKWLKVNSIYRRDIRSDARQIQVEYDQTPMSPKKFSQQSEYAAGPASQFTILPKPALTVEAVFGEKTNLPQKYTTLPSIPRRQQAAEPEDYGYDSVRSSRSNLYAPVPHQVSSINIQDRRRGSEYTNVDDLANKADNSLSDFVLVANKIKGRGGAQKKAKRKNLLQNQPSAPAPSPVTTHAQEKHRHNNQQPHLLDLSLPSPNSNAFSATHSKYQALPAIQTKQLLPTDNRAATTKVTFVPSPPAAPKTEASGQRSFHRRHKVIPPINTNGSLYEMQAPPPPPPRGNNISARNSNADVLQNMWCQGRTVKNVRATQ